MSGLVQFAKTELRAAGMFDANADYDGEVAPLVVSLMETFAAYGQSGGSAALTLEAFNKLARYKPLTPLTGADDEWNEVGEEDGKPMYQNRRCSTVFKHDGRAWDLDMLAYTPDGKSADPAVMRHPITFPYEVA